MTDPQRLVAVLLDRSGSVETINSHTHHGVVYVNQPVDQAPPLTLQPHGMTALYDGAGRLITGVGADLAVAIGQQ